MSQEELDSYWRWGSDPAVIDVLIGLSIAWIVVHLAPIRNKMKPGSRFPWKKGFWFFLGIFLLFSVLVTPIDPIGERYLFSVHMFQHVVLIYPVPVCLLLGIPGWWWDKLLENEEFHWLMKRLVHPITANLLFNFLLYAWHVPAFYQWAMRDPGIHVLEHASFIVSSVLLWWPLYSQSKTLPPLHYGKRLLHILAAGILQIPLFAFITFATSPFYPVYAAAPRITSLGVMEDQWLGGVIMKLAVMIFSFLWLIIFWFYWYQEENTREDRGATLSKKKEVSE